MTKDKWCQIFDEVVEEYDVLYYEELPKEKQKEVDVEIDKRWEKYLDRLNEKYINDPKFLIFINKEFYSVALNSRLEELAEFAFGSMKKAITAFESKNQIE